MNRQKQELEPVVMHVITVGEFDLITPDSAAAKKRVKELRNDTTDQAKIDFDEAILHKLAESRKNGPIPMCEIHQIPMVRMKGKRGPFWSCHQKDEDGNWCDYRP